ncbi:ras-domain-containing protein [Rhodofomes roseus]|uniref:Ras-domain-containing protein n=1 Tax=Rhodofomes roseus TaxID=34475 RepID=A0ABQ8KHL4_9APHY|nr:ras-domain-containing protein [Rhodofomes roseus]KAH9836823.1 ras-domain-containing protein [Rhodofomes roseus]
MRTVKVVVIGASGVGKTSLRNQYISGRFTTGYRATIGADFITKSVPHHSSPDETVTLQLWDTAGQERFSSLSSAFFRGADAAILLFDVNKPETLQSLVRWWADFREKAPVPDEDLQDFCCVVVGNKIDLARDTPPVSEADVVHLIDELVPPPSPPLAPILSVTPIPETDTDEDTMPTPIAAPGTPPSKSIDITARRPRRSLRSVSRSRSRSTVFRGGTVGTMTTTHTIYHTPSSSVFDLFESALSSPAHTTISMSARSASPVRSPSYSPTRVPRRQPSSSTVSSAPTITPSLFHRERAPSLSTTPTSGPSPAGSFSLPPHPERRPKLFFASAKTGEGVVDVFEYVARRVVMRWEYEEALDARTLHMQEADETIRLTHAHGDRRRLVGSCCGT